MAEKQDYASALRRMKSKNGRTRSRALRIIKAAKKQAK
ncbi:putative metal homeostasis protein [Lacticaseibacillus saniviri]|nr:putative metal homeostasis protein [Lacticaseibacillus saniviri]MCG4282601.1 putative metal homeostasis protein [Lacticaseibacillus saniviri]